MNISFTFAVFESLQIVAIPGTNLQDSQPVRFLLLFTSGHGGQSGLRQRRGPDPRNPAEAVPVDGRLLRYQDGT